MACLNILAIVRCIPVVNQLIERGGSGKHSIHIYDLGSIPILDWLVEGCCTRKEMVSQYPSDGK